MEPQCPPRPPLEPTSSAGRRPRRAILLTSYMTGAADGENLGVVGYSYDIVTKLFLPLLERCGEVIPVRDPKRHLQRAAQDARQRGLPPVHLGILPFQDAYLAESVPNVVMPAWEFPDIPTDPFGCNPQNDWPATANRCSLVLVGGPFTANALKKAGVETPVRVVQVPTPQEYFELPSWQPASRTMIDCPCYVLPQASPSSVGVAAAESRDAAAAAGNLIAPPQRSIARALAARLRWRSKRLIRSILPDRIARTLANVWRVGKATWRNPGGHFNYAESSHLDLSGIVYTSILNPIDGRKNWQDLLTGFLLALGDRPDVTLVVKLVSSDPYQIGRFIGYYKCRDIPHRCKLVIITKYLSDEQMLRLAEASTYYVQTTKAEGNCLPLMNYLAAGRPGISPRHSAIADYFDEKLGFVVDSHPEPAAWPHDPSLRIRTSWGRLVWPSLVEQLRQSYRLAKHDRAQYGELAARGRQKMLHWASPASVEPRLRSALELVVPGSSSNVPIRPRQAA
jgi:glycosyltransferase involved in cell wall biosynthesis